MTVRDILEGYGINFDSLTFKMNDFPADPEPNTAEEVKHMLETDEIIVNGEFIDDIDIVADDPHGYIELYPKTELEDILAQG
jgi:hypothetical protein